MQVDFHAPYKDRVQQALSDPNLRSAVSRATDRMSNARQDSMDAVEGQKLRTQVRQMKEHVLRNWPEYLEQLETNLTSNGCTVHWAEGIADAQDIVKDIALQNSAKLIVKSKSMATEEIHLNQAMEEVGLRVVETDLGEYIIQLADEPPLARARLRQEFFAAGMGISGCNFAIAETGTIGIVTNEGNGRMVSSMPRVYVAVMGIEKLVPTVEDAYLQLQALCRSATGQQLTVYCSMTSGPRQQGDVDGPEQVHVVLLDNGRSRMFARGYGEALMCIRCGACLNACPVYQEIGGHAYGSTYNGPIGAVITPALAPEIGQFKELPHATSLCGACREVCPVKIDLPRLLLDLRSDLVQQGVSPKSEAWGIKSYASLMSSRRTYESLGKMASIGSNVYASLSGGNIKFLPPPLNGWTAYRDFAPFAPKSFRHTGGKSAKSCADKRRNLTQANHRRRRPGSEHRTVEHWTIEYRTKET